MAKIITDKLITDKLEAKGYLEYDKMDETKAWNLLEKHYDCEVSDQWTNKHFDFYCYSETTADGYEVFIATNNIDSICVGEDYTTMKMICKMKLQKQYKKATICTLMT